MNPMEHRIAKLETALHLEHAGPSLADRLGEARDDARERRRLGLPTPLLEAEGPLGDRYRMALARAQQARAHLSSGEPGPW
jgi:hypothetical protein